MTDRTPEPAEQNRALGRLWPELDDDVELEDVLDDIGRHKTFTVGTS